MKRAVAAAVLAAAIAAGVSAAGELRRLPPAAPAGQQVLYGHVKALTRAGKLYRLSFDPALWLTGGAASRAYKQDTGESVVPNDYYVVDEGHRLFTYDVSPAARVTILTGGVSTTAIGVPELAQIVAGRNPRGRKLFDTGRHLGWWIRVSDRYPNAVVELDQQYQP